LLAQRVAIATRPTSCLLPNLRLKLSGCGGRLVGNRLPLIAPAAPRSLSATR
jgi:hypothetical protein